MDDMEAKMGAILNNPEMMQQIMSMAQSLSQGQQAPAPTPAAPQPAEPSQQAMGSIGEIDLSMLQKITGIAKQTGIDSNQQTLLRALNPYLSSQRITKLERAMRAAKLANLASSFLGTQGLKSLLGR